MKANLIQSGQSTLQRMHMRNMKRRQISISVPPPMEKMNERKYISHQEPEKGLNALFIERSTSGTVDLPLPPYPPATDVSCNKHTNTYSQSTFGDVCPASNDVKGFATLGARPKNT